jgi:hypothetical protein
LSGVATATSSSATTDLGDSNVSLPLAAEIAVTVLLSEINFAVCLLASATVPRTAENSVVLAITLTGEIQARKFEDDAASPRRHFGDDVGRVETAILTDVTLNTVSFGLVLPPRDRFVRRGNGSDEVGTGVLDVEVLRLEASPRSISRLDATLSWHATFIHGEALVLDCTSFGSIRPNPFVRGVAGVETDPHRHVGLGGNQRLLFVGSNGGEVTLHSEKNGSSAIEACRVPADTSTGCGRCSGDEAVEVTSEDVVERALTESPSDTTCIEVVGSGVENDSGDGVEIFGDRSCTSKIKDTSLSVKGVVDVEITLVIEKEFVFAADVVGVDTNGGTVNDVEVRDRDLCKGMETLFSLHGDRGESLRRNKFRNAKS